MDYLKLRTQLDEVLRGEHDHLFTDLVTKIHCMSRPRVYAVLNALVSCMEPGEVYLEVGTFQGGSMIAALTGNEAVAVGVDNFAEFRETNNYEQTKQNLDTFGVGNRVTLRNMSYKDFFAQVRDDFKAAVYFYDGQHDYEGQLAGMEAGWPHLKSGSLLVVDDFIYPPVNLAINQFIANHAGRVQVFFALDSINATDAVWWNGVFVLRVL